MDIDSRARMFIVTGHYGCGKTNLSLNLAYTLRARGKHVTLVDLDIANPFFRSSDLRSELEAAGMTVAGPAYANTNRDAPALEAGIYAALESVAGDENGVVVVDVGGDDVGATTLGRFHEKLSEAECEMFYVVNRRRLQTASPKEALELLGEIESASRLKATALVGNTHLKQETSLDTVAEALPHLRAVSEASGLPIAFVTVPRALAQAATEDTRFKDLDLYPVDVYVKTPWE